jgi:catechol 2,3-dioxygenase-like lactoylglutathione lyase family enzyme
VIIGAHALVYVKDAERTRAFFRDVLGFPHVDAGEGWLIFRLPPAEVGVHPDEKGGFHELYFMCDDVEKTMVEMGRKGVVFTKPVQDQGYGLVTAFRLPDGSEMGLYQPRHPMAIALPGKAKPAAKRKPKAARKRRRAAPRRKGRR